MLWKAIVLLDKVISNLCFSYYKQTACITHTFVQINVSLRIHVKQSKCVSHASEELLGQTSTNKRRTRFLTLSDPFTVLRSYSLHFWYQTQVSGIVLKQRKQELMQIYITSSCFEDVCTHRTANSSWTGSKDLNFQKNFCISECVP